MKSSSYAAELDAAATAAHAPRAPDAPTVISTFAGRGGSSTGYHMAGFRELLAVEWDAHAAATLRLNYPALDVYHGDIAALSVDEVLERCGLQPGELDLFDGSPPCQGFSTMGRRQLDDPRNQLFREYLRLLEGLRPRTFVMENVKGMVAGKMRGIYREAMQAFQAAGYRTVSGVLNAAQLGVPQARERLIVIGVREDLGIQPTLPRPYSRIVTVRDALCDLPQTPNGYRITKPEWLAVYARVKPGQDFGDVHPQGHFFSYRKLHPDRPSPTIVKTVGVTKAGEAGGGIYHWRFPRLLTVPELKRLGSFPDDYQFAPGKDEVDTFIQTWAGIGNSVPPLMTRAIAQHVRDTVLEGK